MALSIHLFLQKRKKSSASLRGWGEQIGVGKRERGGATSPLPLLFPDHPSLPSPSPGPVRSDEIIFIERSEVIGREDCWREISIHYTPLYSKGKTKVRSCAPAEERSFGSLPYYYLLKGERGKLKPTPNKLLDRSRTFSILKPAAEGVRFPLYAMWRKRLIQRGMPCLH